MFSSCKIVKLSSCVWLQNATCLHGIYRKLTSQTCCLHATFCTSTESSVGDDSNSIVESPELPSWVKFCENDNPAVVESDDDFVLPKVAKWFNTQRLNDDHCKHVKHMVGEIMDSDVNRLTKALKGKFDSPDAIYSAVAGFGAIDLSESLVEKILQRFSNDWIPAFGFFKWAKHQTGYEHTGNCYNMMVDILGKSKNFGLMWELVEEMDKLGGFVSIDTMSKVLRRLSRAFKYDDAIEAFGKFECLGLIKDTSAMNILMDSLVKENGVEHAQKVFLDLKDSIPLNSQTFNILIHGWCKARKYDKAREVMEQMDKHGCQPNIVSYTSFVEYYCREKDFRKVDGILDEMLQKGCPPNVVTYTIIMLAYGKAKEINASLEIWEKMKRSGCVPDANFYSALIFVMNKSGRFEDACNLFKDMSKQNIVPNVLTYNTMISAACMHSREEFALELLQEMEERSCRPDLKTYAPLLKMCCSKKRMKVLNYLLDDMFRKNVSIDLATYSLLVKGLCNNGKLEHACSFFEQIMLKGMVPRDSTYKLLMEKLEEKGMQKAKEQIEKLMSRGRHEIQNQVLSVKDQSISA